MSLLTPSFGLLFWMVLSFGIVLWILGKYGFPVIVKMVDQRRDYVKQSLATADEANRKLEGIKQESEAIIGKAHVRQSEIIKQATSEGNQLVQNAKQQAAVEAQRKMDDATRQIEAQKQKAMDEIRGEVAALSITIAEKILRKQLDDPQSQDALIDRLLDEVEKQKSEGKA
jgi:F-type H+-transporting ATPase subunit b